MRLFIGIDFGEHTRNALISLINDLREKSKSGRFTLPENLHLTLAFIGECDKAQEVLLKSIMDDIIFNPFQLEIDHIGCFKRSGGDIWWAGLRESKALIDLQSDLAKRLKTQGFPIESRKYSPHITLARQFIGNGQPRTITAFKETVTGIDLIESKIINGKLTYIPIYRKGAGDKILIERT